MCTASSKFFCNIKSHILYEFFSYNTEYSAVELGFSKHEHTFKLSDDRNRKYRLEDVIYKPCNLASFPAFSQSKPIFSRYGNIHMWPICHVANEA